MVGRGCVGLPFNDFLVYSAATFPQQDFFELLHRFERVA
jgi:hypothetical protein